MQGLTPLKPEKESPKKFKLGDRPEVKDERTEEEKKRAEAEIKKAREEKYGTTPEKSVWDKISISPSITQALEPIPKFTFALTKTTKTPTKFPVLKEQETEEHFKKLVQAKTIHDQSKTGFIKYQTQIYPIANSFHDAINQAYLYNCPLSLSPDMLRDINGLLLVMTERRILILRRIVLADILKKTTGRLSFRNLQNK
jgi:hypothetical protein